MGRRGLIGGMMGRRGSAGGNDIVGLVHLGLVYLVRPDMNDGWLLRLVGNDGSQGFSRRK